MRKGPPVLESGSAIRWATCSVDDVGLHWRIGARRGCWSPCSRTARDDALGEDSRKLREFGAEPAGGAVVENR